MTYADCPPWAKALYRHSKKNAATRGVVFDLTKEAFAEVVARTSGRCCLTGIRFDLSAADGKKRPLAPSLDRIRSHRGYTTDNVRLVCVAVNLAMNHWGEAVFRQVARALLGIGDPSDAAWIAGGWRLPPGVWSRARKRRGIVYRAGYRDANGVRRELGPFDTPEAAYEARKKALFGRNLDTER